MTTDLGLLNYLNPSYPPNLPLPLAPTPPNPISGSTV